MIEKIIDDFENADEQLDVLANDITKAVMHLAFGSGSETYRFNQIGIIYQSIQEMIEARADMNFSFNQIVNMIKNTDDAKEGES